MATLFVAFPKYLGHSNIIYYIFVGIFWKFGKFYTQNTYKFVVIMGTNEGTIQIFLIRQVLSFGGLWEFSDYSWFSPSGCIMSVFCINCIFHKLFSLLKMHILSFSGNLRSSIIRQIDLLVAKYFVQGIHFAWCQNVCCSKMSTGESITKWVLFSNVPHLLYMSCIFDSNSSRFCFLPHKFANILCFVGIQNWCQCKSQNYWH